MDISKLSTGSKLVLGGGIVLLIVSFFSWFEVGDIGVASMWEGIGFVAGLALVALLAWEIAQLAGVKLELGVSPALVTVALAILMGVFVVLRFIITPGPDIADDVLDISRTIWAWLGLLLAIVVVAGAVIGMQAAGKSFSDMRTEFSGAVGSRDRAATPPATPAPPADPPASAPPTTTVDTPDDPPRTTP